MEDIARINRPQIGYSSPQSGGSWDIASTYNLDTDLRNFLGNLKEHGIEFQLPRLPVCPPEALMHDRAAVVPAVVVSPRSEWGVAHVLKHLKECNLYERAVSVKSGGHGYFNGGTCKDIMVNLSFMNRWRMENHRLVLEPGCLLGPTIDVLAKHRKVVPHGDCFGVGAGGHFLTAGWDLLLTRLYGLGCQSVVGGRVVLWDGQVNEVNEKENKDLLYAMRGGAAAGVGVVTEIRLELQEEPSFVTWKFTPLTREQLEDICVANRVFENSQHLPNEISVSFRFQYESGEEQRLCSFNIASLLTAEDTVHRLNQVLGSDITDLISDVACWNRGSLMDLRLLPASHALSNHPEMLAEMTSRALQESPQTFWSEKWCKREMERSYFSSTSHWVTLDCDAMLSELYAAFESANDHPCRQRMSALVVLGGGAMNELPCAMPRGNALARYEHHWDNPSAEEKQCRDLTDTISGIFEKWEDVVPHMPYHGDIWKADQRKDIMLDHILAKHDTRKQSGQSP